MFTKLLQIGEAIITLYIALVGKETIFLCLRFIGWSPQIRLANDRLTREKQIKAY